MPLINSMTGRVTSIGEKPERVVQIPRELMPLMKLADLRPPQTGKLNPAETDAKLSSSGMTIADRIRIKSCLRSVDLL